MERQMLWDHLIQLPCKQFISKHKYFNLVKEILSMLPPLVIMVVVYAAPEQMMLLALSLQSRG